MTLSRIYMESEHDKCALFAMQFAAAGCPHYFLRIAGGCAGMSDEDAAGLRNIELAAGGERDGDPKFKGFAVFGATRMYQGRTDNPSCKVLQTITEVFPNIADRLGTEAILLGIASKYNHLLYSQTYGLVLEVNEQRGTFTTVNPSCKSVLITQPSSDEKAHQLDEMKEAVEIVDQLHTIDWQSLLVAYNGGPNTEREILTWAANGKRDPSPNRWQILLIRGSGRAADRYARDPEFLAENANNVHVADNNASSIRAELLKLGALK
ncbi:hypothetical protein BH10CYA1_BH10CYA1_18020 [soil metagenome]